MGRNRSIAPSRRQRSMHVGQHGERMAIKRLRPTFAEHRSYTDDDHVSKRPNMAQGAAVGGVEMVPGGGIEPPTQRFSVACSTN